MTSMVRKINIPIKDISQLYGTEYQPFDFSSVEGRVPAPTPKPLRGILSDGQAKGGRVINYQ